MRSNNKKRDNFILASSIINHVLWSTHPVACRYLQVYAHPITFDSQAILSTSKLISAILLCSCGSFLCPDDDKKNKNKKNESKRREVLETQDDKDTDNLNDSDGDEKEPEQKEGEEEEEEENQLILPINNHKSQRRTKILTALLFGTVATCRASLNTASTNFTLSYNIATVNSLTPIFASIGDAILFKTKLPPALWPCVIISCIGCIVIAVSQSPLLVEVDVNDDGSKSSSYVFTTRDVIGCGLQFGSVLFSAGARLIMKQSEHVLSRDEMVQTNNMCNFALPLLYTLVTNPKGWRSFLFINVQSVVALLTVAVLVYTIGSTGQMSLVRSMGPGLYSSLSAIRVLGAVFLSSFCLNEPVKNWFEWIGLFITMITMTIYTIVSMGTKVSDAKNVCNHDDGKTEEVPKESDGNEKVLETSQLLPSSPIINEKIELVSESRIRKDPNGSLQKYDSFTIR